MILGIRFPAALLPIIGALFGLCGGLCILVLPKGPGAVAAVTLWTAGTLAAGERGLARWFTKLPLFGSLIGGVTILVRWYALISLHSPSNRMLCSVTASLAIAQAATVALAWVSRPADDAAVKRLAPLTTNAAVIAMALGALALWPFPMPVPVVLGLAAYLSVRLVSWYAAWRFGGVRASDLEAHRVILETACLALLASLLTGHATPASYH